MLGGERPGNLQLDALPIRNQIGADEPLADVPVVDGIASGGQAAVTIHPQGIELTLRDEHSLADVGTEARVLVLAVQEIKGRRSHQAENDDGDHDLDQAEAGLGARMRGLHWETSALVDLKATGMYREISPKARLETSGSNACRRRFASAWFTA